VELRRVEFDKGWVKGQLDRVTLGVKARSARIEGGHLDVDVDQRGQSSVPKERNSVQAAGLSVHAKKGSWKGRAEGVSWDGKAASFSSAVMEGPQGKVTTGQGRYEPRVQATVALAIFTLPLPMKVPGFDRDKVSFTVEGAVFDEVMVEARASKVNVEGHLQTGDAHVVLRPEQVLFTFGWVEVQHPWLSTKPERVEGVAGAVGREAPWDIRLDTPIVATLSPGEQRVGVWGSCAQWSAVVARDTFLQSVPLTGHLAIAVAMKPIPSLKMDQPWFPATCAPVSCDAFKPLRSRFTYTAYKADGTPFQRTTGPTAADWVPVAGTGKMPLAVENLEDPGFSHHRGFIQQAYENSLIENLKTGKCTRGGSTLTMQLAKNLYLGRDKTMLRKAQELLLAMAMEKCLSKAEIMGLYLNVVEFGPNVYGVGPGARHWFKKAPAALDLTEAFWMASILPRPRKAGPPTEAALAGIEKLMGRLAEQGKLPEFVPASDGEVDTSGWETTP